MTSHVLRADLEASGDLKAFTDWHDIGLNASEMDLSMNNRGPFKNSDCLN